MGVQVRVPKEWEPVVVEIRREALKRIGIGAGVSETDVVKAALVNGLAQQADSYGIAHPSITSDSA